MLIILVLVSACLVRLMVAVGTLDHPGARSSHTVATPKGGGVGIVAAFVLGLAGCAVAAGRVGAPLAGLAAATLLLAGVSYLDDVRSWPPLVKLAAQLAATALVMACGVRLHGPVLPWLGPVAPGWWGAALTAGWLLFVTNAVNFMDGLNGLASGTAAIACLALAAVGPGLQPWFLRAAALAMAAGVAGFLPFNFPRARIFMGDVGSQPCGFAVGCMGVLAASPSRASAPVLLVPLVLAPMLLDVAFTLVRRVIAGDHLTHAHRGHLYQLAHRCGMPGAQVAAIYWAMASWGGLCGLTTSPVMRASSVVPPIVWLVFVTVRAKPRVSNW